jgi:hypothetical protein
MKQIGLIAVFALAGLLLAGCQYLPSNTTPTPTPTPNSSCVQNIGAVNCSNVEYCDYANLTVASTECSDNSTVCLSNKSVQNCQLNRICSRYTLLGEYCDYTNTTVNASYCKGC